MLAYCTSGRLEDTYLGIAQTTVKLTHKLRLYWVRHKGEGKVVVTNFHADLFLALSGGSERTFQTKFIIYLHVLFRAVIDTECQFAGPKIIFVALILQRRELSSNEVQYSSP